MKVISPNTVFYLRYPSKGMPWLFFCQSSVKIFLRGINRANAHFGFGFGIFHIKLLQSKVEAVKISSPCDDVSPSPVRGGMGK